MLSMLKKIIPLPVLMVLLLLSLSVSALPAADSITMCEHVQTNGDVTCQGILDPPEIGTLDKEAYFDIMISGMTEDDIIVINLYNANEVLQRQDSFNPDILINNHLVYPVDVSKVYADEAGVWNLTIHAVDPDQNLVEIGFFKFTVEYEETQPCADFDKGYHCCEPPLICPRGNRITEGTCDLGTCCDAEENCQEPIKGKISRTEVNCADAGLANCERIAGSLYNYSIHGPLDKSAVIELTVRDIEISCFDKTDIAIGYYDEANERWIELASYVTEVADGIYEVSALIDYLGYVGVIKTRDCVEISCTAGGYQFEPTSGWVGIDETLKFKICGLVPGCDATEDGTCDENCPEGMDHDCTQTSCANTNDNCCLISKDDICDPDCDLVADPDCCNKSKEGCCPGDLQRSGSQSCDKNCGLADTACTALENGCTKEADDCCHPANDGTCDLDCAPIKPHGGNPDPDCGEKNSTIGDSCNPVADGKCDLDCVFGVDADCIGGYIPYCGNGLCDGGETYELYEPECEPSQHLSCPRIFRTGTECAADCGAYDCTCEEAGGA